MTMADNNERLLAACKAGDLTTVRSCLSASVDVNTKDGYGGSTPLHLALLYKHPQVVTELLYRQDIDLAVVNSMGRTALHYACVNGMAAVIPILGSRMSVQMLNRKDRHGYSALMEAVYTGTGHLSCVEEMAKLEGVDCLTRNRRGETLEDVARYGIGRRIIEIGITLVFTCNLDIFIAFNMVSFIRMNRCEHILPFLQKRKPLQQLCVELITNHRDLLRKEVEELPRSLKNMVKSQWSY